LLFGDLGALKGALDARDGYTPTVDANSQVADMIGAVDSGMVWSVLDQQGTQNMLRSALGDAAGLADYDTIKKRILGSRYTMNFQSGGEFRSGCDHFRLHDRHHTVFTTQGGHAVQENVSHSYRKTGTGERDRKFRQFEPADALQSR